jgi:hypothetical protein
MPRDNEIVMLDQKNINFCIRLHFFLNFWSSEPWIPNRIRIGLKGWKPMRMRNTEIFTCNIFYVFVCVCAGNASLRSRTTAARRRRRESTGTPPPGGGIGNTVGHTCVRSNRKIHQGFSTSLFQRLCCNWIRIQSLTVNKSRGKKNKKNLRSQSFFSDSIDIV